MMMMMMDVYISTLYQLVCVQNASFVFFPLAIPFLPIKGLSNFELLTSKPIFLYLTLQVAHDNWADLWLLCIFDMRKSKKPPPRHHHHHFNPLKQRNSFLNNALWYSDRLVCSLSLSLPLVVLNQHLILPIIFGRHYGSGDTCSLTNDVYSVLRTPPGLF